MEIGLAVEPLGAEPGKWCHTCALPSGYEVTFALLLEGEVVKLIVAFGCESCGTEPIVDIDLNT